MQRKRGEPFFTPDDVRYLHQAVIDNIGKVVSGKTVLSFPEHLVVQRFCMNRHCSPDKVLHRYGPVFRHLKPYNPGIVLFKPPGHFI